MNEDECEEMEEQHHKGGTTGGTEQRATANIQNWLKVSKETCGIHHCAALSDQSTQISQSPEQAGA